MNEILKTWKEIGIHRTPFFVLFAGLLVESWVAKMEISSHWVWLVCLIICVCIYIPWWNIREKYKFGSYQGELTSVVDKLQSDQSNLSQRTTAMAYVKTVCGAFKIEFPKGAYPSNHDQWVVFAGVVLNCARRNDLEGAKKALSLID